MRAASGWLPLLSLLLALRSPAQMPVAAPSSLVVKAIAIEGIHKTKPFVILRELTLAEGDTVPSIEQLNYLIERSAQNVRNLGLFNGVRISPLDVAPGEVFLLVHVEERFYYQPTPIFKFADPNFNQWLLTGDWGRTLFGFYLQRLNMRGRNETLSAKVQLGYAKEFALRYRFPYIDREQRWGLAVGGGITRQDEITVGTTANIRDFITLPGRATRKEWRADVETTLRPAFDQRHAIRIGYLRSHVVDSVVRAMPTYFQEGSAEIGCFHTSYTFTHDQRDSRFFPLSGTWTMLRLDHYGLPFLDGGDVDLTTWYAAVSRSWRTSERWSLGASFRGKVSVAPELPYYLQQGLGYDDYVRGYEYYVIDGEHYGLLKANAFWALVKPREYELGDPWGDNFRTFYLAVYLNAFVDLGYVWDSRYQDRNRLDNMLQRGYGLGLDLVTSYDVVMRLETAVNHLGEPGLYLHFKLPF